MTGDALLKWFPYAFPFFFVSMWLFITAMLGVMSGWFNLQQWYADDGSEEPLLKLGGQSGVMGLGVGLNGCLKLWAYPSGLGIRIWRIFGPFSKPLKVPWSEIDAEPSRSFFVPMMKLSLGKPANGTLKISAKSWSRLVAAAKPAARGPLPDAPPVDDRRTALSLFLQWLAVSAFITSSLFVMTREEPHAPPAAMILFPAVAFGVTQIVRYARG